MTTRIYHRTAEVKGRKIFYREAGDPAAPTILQLHGLPTSSQMFRDLIPGLADRFHLIAPDYVGFGHSDAPSRGEFTYVEAAMEPNPAHEHGFQAAKISFSNEPAPL